MATAIWQGKVFAEVVASDVVVVEGNNYFPFATVRAGNLHASSQQTACSWKGTAHYYDVVVDGHVNKNAA